MLSEGLGLSGIVSILFTGIVSACDIFLGYFMSVSKHCGDYFGVLF
jgi:hypothetical protein